MIITSNGVTHIIKEEDIIYIESFGRKLIIHSKTGKTETYGKMSDIINELGDEFYQIHRSYIVNMRKIANCSKNEVIVENGDKPAVSKYRYDGFINAYTSYLEKNKM